MRIRCASSVRSLLAVCVRQLICIGCVSILAGITGCSDVTFDPSLPEGSLDPKEFQTPSGAAMMYVAAVSWFQKTNVAFIETTGLFTDEFQANARGESFLNTTVPQRVSVDSRNNITTIDGRGDGNEPFSIYRHLHGVRNLALQGIAALKKYDPDNSANRQGELYALKGYATLMLADLFCSGIPLSDVAFEKDFVYRPGSSSEDVYRAAIALFDTALVLATDSAPILNLARVGKGRTWLMLGQYDSARMAVQSVPSDFRYLQYARTCKPYSSECEGDNYGQEKPLFTLAHQASVANREGGVGLPFISSGDPRTESANIGTTKNGATIYFPQKYALDSISTIVIADGIEARLTEAEAAMWASKNDPTAVLTILNQLRSTIEMPSIDPSTVPTAKALEDTVFAERAAWLFATGHRQGDLRRRVVRYQRMKQTVYPIGAYQGVGQYGMFIDFPIPIQELVNPLFKGCINRD